MYSNLRELYDNFQWDVPSIFNIAYYTSECHINQKKLALIYEDYDGNVFNYSFEDLDSISNQLANYFKDIGMQYGDRIGILLSQQPETIISHLAGFKIGAINIPLFTLFGPEALQFRLHDSETKLIIVESENLDKVLEIQNHLPNLEYILCISEFSQNHNKIISFYEAIENYPNQFECSQTSSDDPALIIYTSGTTGPPKGALHAHRVLIGHLPGIQVSHNFFPQNDDIFWTPADWAWIGGLLDVVFPSLYYGVPVVAKRFKKFNAKEAINIIAKYKVKNVFLPPTALKMMYNDLSVDDIKNVHLRSVASGGEYLGQEMLKWGLQAFGLHINEFYGQTEANLLVSNCSQLMLPKPNSIGKPVPGHHIEIIDENGHISPEGETGEIAVQYPDPVMFLGYWKNNEATEKKFKKGWLTTGDMAYKDKDGFIFFKGRDDDVITSAGYRIGPSEVEDCLLKHPAVSLSAVIGKPDSLRGQIVKAFIKLKPDYSANEELAEDIKQFVKRKLAAHEYPREITFVDDIPLTVTGKVKRAKLRNM
ncbi:MAG: acyl-CoA synthetase [Halanaerobiales bacterium]